MQPNSPQGTNTLLETGGSAFISNTLLAFLHDAPGVRLKLVARQGRVVPVGLFFFTTGAFKEVLRIVILLHGTDLLDLAGMLGAQVRQGFQGSSHACYGGGELGDDGVIN